MFRGLKLIKCLFIYLNIFLILCYYNFSRNIHRRRHFMNILIDMFRKLRSQHFCQRRHFKSCEARTSLIEDNHYVIY